MLLIDQPKPRITWAIRKFANQAAYEAGELMAPPVAFGPNLMLDEGAALLASLLIGGAGTPFSNANARLGVGDDATAAAAGQTGLQAVANKAYVAMEVGYPQQAGGTLTWRAVFDGNTANHAWQEFTVANGADDTAVNLNRKVSDQGTKALGQVWTLDLQITFA